MAKVARIPITNIYMGGDYTGRILVGPQQKPMNVILDTGSSALALDGHKYQPETAAGDKVTDLAQTDAYGDGSSWTGAVITTTVAAGAGASQVTLANANVAVAYDESADMFGATDGILGLAYAPLDNAFKMPGPTWPKKYTAAQVRAGTQQDIAPYLTQLAGEDVVSDKVAFYTRRSFVHQGGGADDPLNQGWMIVGGGEESTDLYTGTFQSVKVLADEWYNTNLKSIQVGTTTPLKVGARGAKGMPSNSIVDSGTNSLNLGPTLLKGLFTRFSAEQQALLQQSVYDNRLVAVSELGNLASWPKLTFVLEGDAGDVSLTVNPGDYWQVNTQSVGAALCAITVGEPGLDILGLPIMNGYFTIFDGEADGGRGVIKFATRK
ncbi:MAG TPA: pepsin-like aspartic protease [Polyangia bacterium]|nr:pepsin-like aspartic protease [Polyangia bacterium]